MKWKTYSDYIPESGLCLVKTNEGNLDIRRYTSYIWDGEYSERWIGDYSDQVAKFIELSDLDDVLSGNADYDMRCNFSHTLCEVAIPALEKWLKNRVTHPVNLSEEEWEMTLTKILESFKESKKLMDGEYDKLPSEEYGKKCDEVLHLRVEAFMLMAIHFLDMWD